MSQQEKIESAAQEDTNRGDVNKITENDGEVARPPKKPPRQVPSSWGVEVAETKKRQHEDSLLKY